MPAEVLLDGPMPPHGAQWCFVCAYSYKAAVNDLHALTIEQAMKEPDGSRPVVIDTNEDKDMPPLFIAVARGLYMPLQHFGPLDLCWSHLTAIRLQSTGGLSLPVPGQQIPGMGGGMNGMGGFRG